MAENITLQIPAVQLQQITGKEIDLESLLDVLFADKDNHALMCNRLERYHWGSGTFPQVEAFTLEHIKFDAETLTGKFRCRFRVGFSFTCSGTTGGQNDTIAWDVKIDPEKQIMFLYGEEPLMRDGDDL